MGETTTKIKLYIFLCVICLLFNLSICATAFATESTTIVNTGSDDTGINASGYNGTIDTVMSTVVGIGTSFLPFVGLVNIATLNLASVPLLMVFYIFVTVIIGILQALLIALIILNMLPFFNA